MQSAHLFVFAKFRLECYVGFIAQIILQFLDEAGNIRHLRGFRFLLQEHVHVRTQAHVVWSISKLAITLETVTIFFVDGLTAPTVDTDCSAIEVVNWLELDDADDVCCFMIDSERLRADVLYKIGEQVYDKQCTTCMSIYTIPTYRFYRLCT